MQCKQIVNAFVWVQEHIQPLYSANLLLPAIASVELEHAPVSILIVRCTS